jgi:hypothetical protein
LAGRSKSTPTLVSYCFVVAVVAAAAAAVEAVVVDSTEPPGAAVGADPVSRQQQQQSLLRNHQYRHQRRRLHLLPHDGLLLPPVAMTMDRSLLLGTLLFPFLPLWRPSPINVLCFPARTIDTDTVSYCSFGGLVFTFTVLHRDLERAVYNENSFVSLDL